MDAPDGYEIRHPRRDEAPAIAAVLIATELDAFGSIDTDENDVTEDWAYEGFDLDEDAWVAIASDDSLVGYAAAFKKIPGQVIESYGGVDPAHHGRGLGAALLDRLEHRALSHLEETGSGAVVLQNYVIGVDERGKELHRSRGFEVIRGDWSMEIDLSGELREFPPPDGITIRTLQPGEERAAYELMESAFQDHWQHTPTSYESWHARCVDTPSFDPDMWLVAFEGDRMVGGAFNAIRVGRGFVNDLGVLREARKRGLAAHLLYRSFRLFQERGLTQGGLFVDAQNLTGATRLYERVGMTVAREYELYGKEIRRES
jgi:mycothiol synthase